MERLEALEDQVVLSATRSGVHIGLYRRNRVVASLWNHDRVDRGTGVFGQRHHAGRGLLDGNQSSGETRGTIRLS